MSTTAARGVPGRGGPDKTASWQYAEAFVPDSEVVERARGRAAALGVGALGTGAGTLLRTLVAATGARSVVEVGTGAGVSGLFLLSGMPREGVLTTIEVEPEHLDAARTAFAEAGARGSRVRAISGPALDVLPRLADGSYDLVLLDADPTGTADYLERAVALLRPHGLLVVAGALAQDRVGDPAQRDPVTTAVRQLARSVRDREDLLPALVPSSGGLLLAARRSA